MADSPALEIRDLGYLSKLKRGKMMKDASLASLNKEAKRIRKVNVLFSIPFILLTCSFYPFYPFIRLDLYLPCLRCVEGKGARAVDSASLFNHVKIALKIKTIRNLFHPFLKNIAQLEVSDSGISWRPPVACIF